MLLPRLGRSELRQRCLNAGTTELEGWKMYIGFQHREILVSASGAVLVDGSDFPADVGKG
ncbi:hypothetical protein CSA_004763 [Cucumis sativus]|uniref:Uncharacterized protein n=1 Tax=Cucumis sativus TaxID=3659 RepID=A0ACB6HC51_CUCSA|nr:hypothetical protein CSA_004763 [Cucumis sativus]